MDPTKVIAWLGLGSNIEDRESYLQQAVTALRNIGGTGNIWLSPIYETDPVGFLDQGPFLNMVLALETTLTSGELLQAMQQIEWQLQRKREIKNGPRTLDLDLLIFGNEINESEHLTLPHPRMSERAFVLIPLQQLLHESAIEMPAQVKPMLRMQTLHDKGVRLWKSSSMLVGWLAGVAGTSS